MNNFAEELDRLIETSLSFNNLDKQLDHLKYKLPVLLEKYPDKKRLFQTLAKAPREIERSEQISNQIDEILHHMSIVCEHIFKKGDKEKFNTNTEITYNVLDKKNKSDDFIKLDKLLEIIISKKIPSAHEHYKFDIDLENDSYFVPIKRILNVLKLLYSSTANNLLGSRQL